MARSLQGATLAMAPTIEMPWAPVAPPIAGGPANFTDEQLSLSCKPAPAPTARTRYRQCRNIV